jgi:hypothetical protein
MRLLLDHAASEDHAIAAFNVQDLLHAEAVLEAARQAASPVIVQAIVGGSAHGSDATFCINCGRVGRLGSPCRRRSLASSGRYTTISRQWRVPATGGSSRVYVAFGHTGTGGSVQEHGRYRTSGSPT